MILLVGADIVRSGGVKVLIQSVENRVSAKQLESSTRAILGLATNNALSIKTLVNDGAIGVLKSNPLNLLHRLIY